MLLGTTLCGAFAAMYQGGGLLAPLLAPLAAVFVIARQYTFDPYYFPGHRRIADGGVFSEVWLAGFLVVALIVAWVTTRSPQLGLVLTGGVLLAGSFIAVLQNAGH